MANKSPRSILKAAFLKAIPLSLTFFVVGSCLKKDEKNQMWETYLKFHEGMKNQDEEVVKDTLSDIAFSQGGEVFATAHANNMVYVWDTATANNLAALGGHTKYAKAVAFSPDGSKLVSAGEDYSLIVWE